MGTQKIWGPLPPTPREGQNLKTFFIYFIHIYSKATENLSSVNRHTASGHLNLIKHLLSFIIIVQVNMLCARHKPRIKGWVQNSNGNIQHSKQSYLFTSIFPLRKKYFQHTSIHNDPMCSLSEQIQPMTPQNLQAKISWLRRDSIASKFWQYEET